MRLEAKSKQPNRETANTRNWHGLGCVRLVGEIAVNALADIEKEKFDSRWWWQASRGAAQEFDEAGKCDGEKMKPKKAGDTRAGSARLFAARLVHAVIFFFIFVFLYIFFVYNALPAK